jgi:adenosine kinase
MSFRGKFREHFLAEKLDRISVSFLVDSLIKQQGGCAANIAFSLALLEENPLLVGAVGKDFESYRDFLEKAGVDTSGVHQFNEEYTASFFANTDNDGNQIASFYSGAMKYAKNISLKNSFQKKDAIAIISPNDPEAMCIYPEECRDIGFPFIYDPGQQIVCLEGNDLKAGIRDAKMLILNEYELEMFKNKTELKDEDLTSLVEIVVITLGDQGAIIRTSQKNIEIPIARTEKVLDPTGVGDAFRAGLMKGMIHGLSWETAGRMASLAATYVIETEGPQSHLYTLESFIKRYVDIFGDSEEIKRLIKN